MTEKLSRREAQKLVLHSQCLLSSGKSGKAIDATFSAIQHLGYIQIDTISVVQRAHHHTLWSRNGGYRPCHIDVLQKQRKIFEYWSHAAAYLPMEDYRYCLRKMKAIAGGQRHWFDRDPKMMKKVLARIRQEGPLQSRDFHSNTTKKRAMWDWKPAKRALEQLFMEGKLMICHRRNFQKVYDLTENVLPGHIDLREPTEKEWIRHLIVRFLQANGLGQPSEIAYLRKGIRPDVERGLLEMKEEGGVIRVDISGNKYYALPESLPLLDRPLAAQRVKILSPFDNFLIQRKRIKQLFDFDYQIECYVAAGKRRFGYFCLPLLWRAELVGRADCKAHRHNQTLIVESLIIERSIKAWEQFTDHLCRELRRFMLFNGCRKIRIRSASRKGLKKTLNAKMAIDDKSL